jgi:hypothetical protein
MDWIIGIPLGAAIAGAVIYAIHEPDLIEICDQDGAINLIEYTRSGAEWEVDFIRMASSSSDGNYISIWYRNEDYGLGVARNRDAYPNDANFSNSCRAAIYNQILPLAVAYDERTQMSLLDTSINLRLVNP